MSRRQKIPSNVFFRAADPFPPLFPEPFEGDIYFNTTRKVLRIFHDKAWCDASKSVNPGTPEDPSGGGGGGIPPGDVQFDGDIFTDGVFIRYSDENRGLGIHQWNYAFQEQPMEYVFMFYDAFGTDQRSTGPILYYDGRVGNIQTPTDPLDAANKAYADSVMARVTGLISRVESLEAEIRVLKGEA